MDLLEASGARHQFDSTVSWLIKGHWQVIKESDMVYNSKRSASKDVCNALQNKGQDMEDNDGLFPSGPDSPTVVHEGDAYDLLNKLPAESVDLIITSPPYWGHRTYGLAHNWEILDEWISQGGSKESIPSYDWYRMHGGCLGMEPLPEWYVSNLAEFFQRGAHALKSQGSMWVNIGDTYFARWSSIRLDGRQGLGNNPRERRKTPMGGFRQEKQLLQIPARFSIAMQDLRWILRNDLIWEKQNVPPRPEKDRLRLAHEHFFHFVKRPKEGRAKYYYDLSATEPGSRDVVRVNAAPGSDGHSATFPVQVIEPRILSSCPPGGLVLDPFCGTGRALAVAARNGRTAIGFEITSNFSGAARRHLADTKKFYESNDEDVEKMANKGGYLF
ncbi:site-specific DNA-methyltransferase [Saccharopolyspora sp. NFXS83]|uniref:DNA-methyltransferase n=1 Tax=Saccharopolyspora sp. NFXS83 TaxID=2993560 RepID=UPI00224A7A35|nr:site-specific DNA-methyltransferase [Saccharopolyspora sp. NFXS83]MCX2734463.1 site-specific DNA-methyltransferase [Saccharopolyspora sp. NFXS83]